MTNILFINNFYNPGGSTLAALELAKGLPTNINKSFIGCIGGELQQEFDKLGKTYLFPPIGNFDYNAKDIHKVIEESQPDLIHIFIPGHENPTYFTALPPNIKKVITVLCTQQVGFDHTLFDKVTFISKYNRSLSPHVKNGYVIRCGLGDKNDDFTPPKIISEPIIGRISAFCPSKKILDTVHCASCLSNVQFIIAGQILDFNYFSIIKHQIKICKLSNIELSYNILNSTKEAIYHDIDILHYPTSDEAFCYSILEGMRLGKAIITYNNSSMCELNHDNNLCIVENNDTRKLLTQTKNYLDNPQEIMDHGIKNRQIYEEYYTRDIYAHNMLNLYNYV